MNRRSFLSVPAATASFFGLASEGHASAATPHQWVQGEVLHILPSVSDTELLIKVSLSTAQKNAPVLQIAGRPVKGEQTDSQGFFWQFHATKLTPATDYRLTLMSTSPSRQLCSAWEIKTLPDPESSPDHLRLLLFTCAGGHQVNGYLPASVRNKLLNRGLSFKPDAAVANGDHIYWDLQSPLTAKGLGQSPQSRLLAGLPDRSAPALGSDNEPFLKTLAGPQIAEVYGTDFRSTPVYFIQDDHDYFENDDATDEIVTFPPDHFMTEMARATQLLYYPEFLRDANRPAGLPGASAKGRALRFSESFGTLRWGKLIEVLMYTVRRSMTMSGPSAVFLEDTVEKWLLERMAQTTTTHVLNIPSNPPGWTAGKWGEWYPDVFTASGQLSIKTPKPYWQTGWLKQHDRLLQAMSKMKGRVPLVVSGDLHACALGHIKRTGDIDLSANPVFAVLVGPIGTRDSGWPSGVRKILPQPSLHLQMEELVKPIEQHGFTIADFTPTSITLRMFKWDKKTQSINDIDSLEPFHVVEMPVPSKGAQATGQ